MNPAEPGAPAHEKVSAGEHVADALALQHRLPPHLHVVALHARGGMSDLVVADDVRNGRRVAVKIAHSAILNDATARRRFAREAELGQRFAQRGLVPVLEVDLDRCLLVMPLLASSLKEQIARAPLPAEALRKLAREVLVTLGHLHAAGILHRDIKPANLLFDDEGHTLLADLGVAREDDATLTASGVLLGTPAYMAPEQLRGLAVDERADIYAVGATLFEAATGHRLHEDGESTDPRSALHAALDDELLIEAIARALTADAAGRFANVGAFLAALDEQVAKPTGARRAKTVAAFLAVLTSLAFLAFLGVVGVGVVGRGAGGTDDADLAAAKATRPLVAVLPFSGAGVDSRAAVAISQLLAQRLGSISDDYDVVGAAALKSRAAAGASNAELHAVAERNGCTLFVTGVVGSGGDDDGVLTVEMAGRDGRVIWRDQYKTRLDDVARTATAAAVGLASATLGRPITESSSPEARLFDQHHTDGLVALHENRWPEALAAFEAAAALRPNDSDVAYQTAIALWWASRPERDLRAGVRRALELDPGETRRTVLEGILLLVEGETVRARALFTAGLARNPDDIDLLYGSFEALYHSGMPADAVRLYRDRLVVIAPQFQLGAHHMVTHALARGDAELLAWCGPFFHLEQHAVRASFAADARLALGDVDGAIEGYLAALEHSPQQAAALWAALTAAWLISLDPELARAALTETRGDNVALTRAFALATGDVDGAEDALQVSLRRLPTDTAESVVLRLGELIMAETDPARVNGFAAQLERAEPDLMGTARAQLWIIAADAVAPAGRAEARVNHENLEVRHAARAVTALRARRFDDAVEDALAAAEAGDGRFALFEYELAAEADEARGDDDGVLRHCGLVALPRQFLNDWGIRSARCRLRMGEAALRKHDSALAQTHAEAVLRLRRNAPADDSFVNAARSLLQRSR